MIGCKVVQSVRQDHYDELTRRFRDLGGLWVKVGYPLNGENKGPLKKSRKGKDERLEFSKVLEIANYMEFGTKTVPARSFIRSTFDRKHDELDAFKAGWYDKVMLGRTSAGKALASIGEKLIGFTKATIRSRIPPPLKKPSLKRRGKPRRDTGTGALVDIEPIPLLDTGQLMNSIQLKVGRGNEAA